MRDYASDCIHLKACRRCAKVYKARNGRACDADTCSAYISGYDNTVIREEDAVEYARAGAEMIKSGYDPYDTYVLGEMPRQCLGDYINSIYEEGRL